MAMEVGSIYNQPGIPFVQQLMNVLVAGKNISLVKIDGNTRIAINGTIADYLKSVSASFSPSGDSHAIALVAVVDGTEETITIRLDSATETTTGLMNASQVQALRNLQTVVSSLQGGINLLSDNDFGKFLDVADSADVEALIDYAHSQGVNPVATGTAVRNAFDGITYLYQNGAEPSGHWTNQGADFYGNINTGTNDDPGTNTPGTNGTVHGRQQAGYVYIEANGLMAVWGFDGITQSIAANTNRIIAIEGSLLSDKIISHGIHDNGIAAFYIPNGHVLSLFSSDELPYHDDWPATEGNVNILAANDIHAIILNGCAFRVNISLNGNYIGTVGAKSIIEMQGSYLLKLADTSVLTGSPGKTLVKLGTGLPGVFKKEETLYLLISPNRPYTLASADFSSRDIGRTYTFFMNALSGVSGNAAGAGVTAWYIGLDGAPRYGQVSIYACESLTLTVAGVKDGNPVFAITNLFRDGARAGYSS